MAGKITWARQLFRRIHEPMRVFKMYPEILKVSGAVSVVLRFFVTHFYIVGVQWMAVNYKLFLFVVVQMVSECCCSIIIVHIGRR